MNQKVTETLRSHLAWLDIPLANPEDTTSTSPKSVRLLDYACGPGLMTRIYTPYVTTTRGIDIAPNMVSEYNQRARSAHIPHETVLGVEGNLFDKSNPAPREFETREWKDFDLATVGFGFHHFEDVVFAASQLRERLRPGGVLVISDFLEGGDVLADEQGGMVEGSEGNHAVHGHGHGHGHGHHGHGHHHGEKEEHAHKHGHEHHHHSSEDKPPQHVVDEHSPEFKEKMNASIVVWHFTIDGVKKFFTEAGFVDVDVITMKDKVYMEMSGIKLWRTVLFAKGRRPVEAEGEEKSEL